MLTSFVTFWILKCPIRLLVEIGNNNSDKICEFFMVIIVVGLLIAIITGISLCRKVAGLNIILLLCQQGIHAHPDNASIIITIVVAIIIDIIVKKKLNQKKKWTSKNRLSKWIFYLL